MAQRVERKLTTILSADVEGYSRLMAADEEADEEVARAMKLHPALGENYDKEALPYKTRPIGSACSTAWPRPA